MVTEVIEGEAWSSKTRVPIFRDLWNSDETLGEIKILADTPDDEWMPERSTIAAG
jgi:hypothetical protein